VRENLRFLARAAGRAGAAPAADTTIDRVGLAAVADQTHRRLSAGQRRRLALGAALVRDPKLLLLDEPHAGLDADGREVLHEIVAAAPGEGRTVVMASHELELARSLATREVRVEAGQTRVVAGMPA
jgi:ABC-type multidrug transport system ATPase subunit